MAWNGFAWVAFFFEQNLLEKLERVAHDVDDFNKRLPRCLHLKQLFFWAKLLGSWLLGYGLSCRDPEKPRLADATSAREEAGHGEKPRLNAM